MTPPPDLTPEPPTLRLPPDALGPRLGWAVLVSILANLALWQIVSGAVRRHVLAPPAPIEITRIVLPPVARTPPKPPRKAVPKKAIQRVIHRTPPRPVITPRPVPRPKMTERPKPRITPKIVTRPKPVIPPKRTARRVVTPAPPVPTPHPVAAPAPPAPHHNVLTARGPSPKPDEFAMPNTGRATVGRPIEHQGTSNAANNTPKPEVTSPEPTPRPVAWPVSEPPAPAPRQEPQRGSDRGASEPSGPTQEAEPVNQVKPEIPEELKHDSFKTFVRVKVDIEADGRFAVTLRTSSGNGEIDRRVLEALNHWKWKPALQNGRPVRSTQRFKFEFEVN